MRLQSSYCVWQAVWGQRMRQILQSSETHGRRLRAVTMVQVVPKTLFASHCLTRDKEHTHQPTRSRQAQREMGHELRKGV